MTIEDALMSQLLLLQSVFKALEDEMFCMGYDTKGPIPTNIERERKLNNAWNNLTDTIELLKTTPEKKEV